MEQNVVALAFDVINLTDIQAHLSAFHFDRHIIFLLFLLHLFDSFSENLRKCKIGDRFYNISQGVYQISLNCELDRRGNKDKRYIFIQFPDFFSSLHAVQMFHLDIEKNDIVVCFIFTYNVQTIVKDGNLEGKGMFGFILFQIPGEYLYIRIFIFNNCNSDHSLSFLFFIIYWNQYYFIGIRQKKQFLLRLRMDRRGLV